MDKSILSTRIPDFELNKQDIYTIDYIEKTKNIKENQTE